MKELMGKISHTAFLIMWNFPILRAIYAISQAIAQPVSQYTPVEMTPVNQRIGIRYINIRRNTIVSCN